MTAHLTDPGLDFGCDSIRARMGSARDLRQSFEACGFVSLAPGGDGLSGDPEPFGHVDDGCDVMHLGDGAHSDLHGHTGSNGDIGFGRQ